MAEQDWFAANAPKPTGADWFAQNARKQDAVDRAASKATGIRAVTKTEKALAWLPTIAGGAGGILGTIEGGLAGGVGLASLLGAGGEAWRQNLLRWLSPSTPVPQTPVDAAKRIGIEGGTQAVAEATGQGLARLGTRAAKGLMEYAIHPPETLTAEFPNVVETAIKERTPVGRAMVGGRKGSNYAQAAIRESSGNTRNLLADAERQGVTATAQDIAQRTIPDLVTDISKQPLSDTELQSVSTMLVQFLKEKGGNLAPTFIKDMKQAAQAIAKPIYRAQQKGNAVDAAQTLRARFNEAIANGSKQALEDVPNFPAVRSPSGFPLSGGTRTLGDLIGESEARTQNLIGLNKALKKAEARRLPLWAQLASYGAGSGAGAAFGDGRLKGAGEGAAATLLAQVLLSPRTTSRTALALTTPAMQNVLRQVPRATVAAIMALAAQSADQPEAKQPER